MTAAATASLNEGDPAPDFKLPAAGGGTLSLADFKGKKLALYFYPKDDTSGCTKEAIEFNSLRSQFAKAGTAILGMSPDFGEEPRQIPHEIRTSDSARRRRGQGGSWSIWRVGREKHVWTQIHGRRTHDFPDRRGWPHRQDLAQGEGSRPRRRGSGGGEGALTAGAFATRTWRFSLVALPLGGTRSQRLIFARARTMTRRSSGRSACRPLRVPFSPKPDQA